MSHLNYCHYYSQLGCQTSDHNSSHTSGFYKGHLWTFPAVRVTKTVFFQFLKQHDHDLSYEGYEDKVTLH